MTAFKTRRDSEEVLMKCPKCHQIAPDTNYKCPFCGEILKPDFKPPRSRSSTSGKKSPVLTRFILTIMVAGLVAIAYLMFSSKTSPKAGAVSGDSTIPEFQPGERVDIRKLIHPGKTNIFDFYSDYCPPCKKISPRLQKLDEMRDDIVVVKIDINRKNVRGIDWNSPLARQYNLSSIPHFIVFDPRGNQTHEGSAAWRLVYQLLSESGV